MTAPVTAPQTPEGMAGWPPPALDPAGAFAQPINLVSWSLFIVLGVVLLIVVAAMGLALFGPERWKERLGRERLVWIGGLGFPVVVLTGLLIYGLAVTGRLTEDPGDGEMRVRVTGEMWWWRVAYLDDAGNEVIQDANELHIPVGVPVTLELESADVIHSFWVPRLGGKVDMIPGRRNLMRIQADEAGVFGGQCAEYCGGPHALMGFVVVAHEPEAFAAVRANLAAPGRAVGNSLAAQGLEVFRASGCGACHAVQGTEFSGVAGPDLTHVGSRRTLGAGILPNNMGTLAGWIGDSQAIKPGNRMPAYPVMTGEELRAVAAYLDGLE